LARHIVNGPVEHMRRDAKAGPRHEITRDQPPAIGPRMDEALEAAE
jgi:hypothetical protein